MANVTVKNANSPDETRVSDTTKLESRTRPSLRRQRCVPLTLPDADTVS